ncbi:MAG TPA: AAA family ATPase, partial [Myxococcota bacterium]|nr:AAA family ATPase [Myxococcota bacterium]
QIQQVPGPVKLLLTGQKGAGKSWSLQHIREVLTPDYRVVWVTNPVAAFTDKAELEIADLLVLLCEALAGQWKDIGWKSLVSLSTMNVELARWIRRLNELRGLPVAPDNMDISGAEFNLAFMKISSEMRVDSEVRKAVRKAGTTDLQIVATHLLKALAEQGRPVLVIFDDLDKMDLASAQTLFGPQFSVLESLPAKMVLTFPYALNFQNVLTQQREVIKNIQVFDKKGATELRKEAIERFTALLLKLVEPERVEGLAVEEAVRYSAGITREFGRIMARAFEFASLSGDPRVLLSHSQEAVTDLRVELQRATQDAERRKGLREVRKSNELSSELERQLLNENMVVEYVNGKPWYDVHPLLTDVVDGWKS